MRARTRPRARAVSVPVAPLLVLVMTLAPLAAALGHPTHPGKWTASTEWGGVAIHMMLLPGFGTHHSRIVWWAGGEHIAGGLKGWTPPGDAAVNGGEFPTSSFTTYALDHPAPADPFCSGHAPLSDGKLLIAGGNTLVEVGIRHAMLFDHDADVNGAWVPVDTMSRRRWYPTVTLLGDGRAVTTSGNEFFHYVTVGGTTESPADSSTRMLERIGVAPAPAWESSAVPLRDANQSSPHEPLPAFSEATVNTADSRQYLFGGLDASGALANQMFWINRDHNVDGQDYRFIWADVSKHPQSPDNFPSVRTGMTALAVGNQDLVYIGGLSFDGPRAEIHHAKVANTLVTWKNLTLGGVTLPPLHGHVAIYDGGDLDAIRTNRIFVWGGAMTTSGPADNTAMYSIALNLAAGTATVSSVTQSGTPPPARQYASLTLDPISRYGMPSDLPLQNPPPASARRYRAMLFGGKLASGAFTNDLHELWIKSATEVEWRQISAASVPVARARHGAASDVHAEWLVISGGEIAPEEATASVMAYDLNCGVYKRADQTTPHWEPMDSLPRATRGHATVMFTPEPAFPRHPEVFDPLAPTGSSWRRLAEAPQWQEWYPFGFTMPRRSGDQGDVMRVFYAGPVDRSMQLTVRQPGQSSWTPLPTVVNPDTANVTFRGGSAVMYRPGNVMKCGTRDTEGGYAHGKTAVIDLKAATPAWSASANRMIGRNNHNLVLLPNGQVLVVGGANHVENGTSNPGVSVTRPQIWNPDTLASGYWYGNDTTAFEFDSSLVDRNYHTSALLLPDGRVLVAGGNQDAGGGQTKADLYSPYYLFDATRPQILGAQARVSYGERFVLSMAAADVNLSKVVLVRPGATTHGFDQNQRYVPLAFSAMNQQVAGQYRYLVTAEADSMNAPPGDYLLFALNAAGTPAIARWIQLRTTNNDVVLPSTVADLVKVCSHGTWAELQWSTPQGDQGPGIKPPVQKYDLRWRTSPMPTEAEFASGNPAAHTPPPALDPDASPTAHTSVYNLTPNTQYYFRLKAKDFQSGSGNWSALSNQLVFTTYDEECGGSGGGGGGCCQEGASARQANGAWLRRPGGGGTGSNPGFLENTLLANIAPDAPATDLLRLPYGPKWTTAGARVRLSRSGSLGTRFTRVRLLSVAQPPEQDAFVSGDRVLSGTLSPPLAVRHADGRDLTASLAADTAFDGHPGDTLLVEFAETRPARIALETSGAHLVRHPARTGIEIQCETAEGWVTAAHHDPRALRSDALHEVPSAGRVRLVLRGDHRLHGIARFAPGQPATVTAYEPQAFTHSSAGPMTAALGEDGALLAPGESMLADFAVNPEQGTGLDWFLEVVGEHEAVAGSGTSAKRQDSGREIPLRFALEQNRPNPFEAVTSIGFELPRRAPVRLEVYDLLGRRVAVLANATYEPGRHSVSWDRRGMRGTRVPAGVYTCRYTAGDHREQRRMIVFP